MSRSLLGYFILCATVAACPFCVPLPGVLTGQALLESQPLVCLVRPVLASDPTLRTELLVVRALRGEGLAPGLRITLARTRTFSSDQIYVLLGRPGELSSARVRAISREASSFLSELARLPAGDGKEVQLARLTAFLSHLGSRDRMIAASVALEFSRADYGVVKALKPHLELSHLVRVLEDPTATQAHRGLLFLLVGIVGTPVARDHLRRFSDEPTTRERVGLDGLLGSLLLMEGERALERVRQLRPKRTASLSTRRFFAHASMRAVEFHATSETGLSRDHLIRFVHGFLDDPETSLFAIDELKALRSWTSWEVVLACRTRWSKESGALERATRTFLEACPAPGARAALRAEKPIR